MWVYFRCNLCGEAFKDHSRVMESILLDHLKKNHPEEFAEKNQASIDFYGEEKELSKKHEKRNLSFWFTRSGEEEGG